jgi:predicted transposase YdaD
MHLSFDARLARLIILEAAQAPAEARALVASPDPDPAADPLEILDLVETILVYKFPKLSREEIRAMLHLPEADLKKTRFYQEVFGEGRQEGRHEGVADILLRLIAAKFGPPDQAIRRRLETADTDTLLRWSERLLNAGSLDEVFGEPH